MAPPQAGVLTPRIAERLRLYAELKAAQAQRQAEARGPIRVVLPDGRHLEGEAGRTTPYEIAARIRYRLAGGSAPLSPVP